MQTLFYFHETDAFPYRPISPIWMGTYALISFMFFFVVDRTTKGMTKPSDLKSDWLRQNTLLSFIHSTISSILVIIAVLRAPEMLDDPLSHINYFNYTLIAFSLGYFLWDFWDCLKGGSSSPFGILVHHLVVITFLSHMLLHTRNIGYGLFALSLEINSIFLHARRLLRWYSPVFSSIYYKRALKLFIDLGNYLTFVLFRFGVVLLGFQALYTQGYRLNPIVRVFTTLSVSTIAVLNLVMFYRLIKNQISRKPRQKENKLIDDSILMTDNNILFPS